MIIIKVLILLFIIPSPAGGEEDWFLRLEARKDRETRAYKALIKAFRIEGAWRLEGKIPSNFGRKTAMRRCLRLGTMQARACKNKCKGNLCNGSDRVYLRKNPNFCHFSKKKMAICKDYIYIGERMDYEQLVDYEFVREEHVRVFGRFML